jgi:TPR repeat protein
MACLLISGGTVQAQVAYTDPPALAAQPAEPSPGHVAIVDPPCEQDDAEACAQLGLQLLEGNGIAKDEARAVWLFAQGCDWGSMRGCTMAGYAYAEGQGVEADLSLAASY